MYAQVESVKDILSDIGQTSGVGDISECFVQDQMNINL